MKELKTLKELDLHKDCDIENMGVVCECNACPEDILRQEAVKWIKDIFDKKTITKMPFFSWESKQEIELSLETKAILVSWIKHFFNVTEEDLK